MLVHTKQCRATKLLPLTAQGRGALYSSPGLRQSKIVDVIWQYYIISTEDKMKLGEILLRLKDCEEVTRDE